MQEGLCKEKGECAQGGGPLGVLKKISVFASIHKEKTAKGGAKLPKARNLQKRRFIRT